MTTLSVLVPAIVGHGLPGSLPAPIERPVEQPVWDHLIDFVRNQRITGFLVAAIREGAVPVTVEQAEEAELALRSSMVTALALEATLVRTGALLDGAAIDYRVLKGTGVAHLDYPDPSLRSFGDIDLLIRSTQYDDAIATLVAADHYRRYPEPRPGFDRRFGKGSCLVGPGGHEIDLHRTLAMGPYGLRIDLEDLWGRASRFDLAGRAFAALAAEERFLHACFHAVLGDNPPRLASMRDVAQMHLARPLDVDLTLRLCSSWGAEAVVSRAVCLSESLLEVKGEGPLSRWAAGFSPDRVDERFLAVYSGASSSFAAKSFEALRAIPGLRDKAAFLFSLVMPTRGYLEERRQSPIRRLRRGFGQVRRGRGSP